MTDLDRRCLNAERELETEIERLDTILSRKTRNPKRYARLKQWRDGAVLELHDMQRCHRAYDNRLAEAYRDPTGQALDYFDFSE